MGNSGYYPSALTAAMDTASEESLPSAKRIMYPGVYKVELITNKFSTKAGKIIEMPKVAPSKQKSLMLNYSFRVVDGTENVPAGSYEYGAMVISPKPGTSAEDIVKAANRAKPQIAALVGPEIMSTFTFSEDWVEANLECEFKDDGKGGFELVRDHNMKQHFMIELVTDIYQGKLKLKSGFIKKLKEGDKSVETGESIENGASVFVDPEQAVEPIGAAGDAPVGVVAPDVF